jgi:hypothetical protein
MARLMPWDNSPEKRKADAKNYGAEYRRSRSAARRRSGGRCEQIGENGRPCGSTDRVQCDHNTPVSQGGTHHLDNLVMRCFRHHAEKTAQEGKGYRKGGGWGRRKRESDPVLATRTRW